MEIYIAKVKFFDEVALETKTEYRLVANSNYAEALKSLSKYYGEDNLIHVTITCVTDGCGNGLPLDEGDYEKYKILAEELY